MLRQRRGVGDEGVLAAGLGDQHADGGIARRKRAVDRAGGFGGTGEGHAGHARILREGRTDGGTVTGQELQHAVRNAGFVQQLHRRVADQVGLFGRLGDHAVAGGQGGADLAEENRQREVPRADADEHTAAVKLQLVGFAGRAGQALGGAELRARLGAVVAQEIDRLAHFGDAVG